MIEYLRAREREGALGEAAWGKGKVRRISPFPPAHGLELTQSHTGPRLHGRQCRHVLARPPHAQDAPQPPPHDLAVRDLLVPGRGAERRGPRRARGARRAAASRRGRDEGPEPQVRPVSLEPPRVALSRADADPSPTSIRRKNFHIKVRLSTPPSCVKPTRCLTSSRRRRPSSARSSARSSSSTATTSRPRRSCRPTRLYLKLFSTAPRTSGTRGCARRPMDGGRRSGGSRRACGNRASLSSSPAPF